MILPQPEQKSHSFGWLFCWLDNAIVLGEITLDKEIESVKVAVQGRKEWLTELVLMLDTLDFWFNIVTP